MEFAANHIDRAVIVGVLVGEHSAVQRADWIGCPAAAHIVDPPETRLVLKHQFDRLRPRPALDDFGEGAGEFFFHASGAAGSL